MKMDCVLGLLGCREGENLVLCEDGLCIGFAWWSRGGKGSSM